MGTDIDCASDPCPALTPGEVVEFSETWDLTYATGTGSAPFESVQAEPGDYDFEFALRLPNAAEGGRLEEVRVDSVLTVTD